MSDINESMRALTAEVHVEQIGDTLAEGADDLRHAVLELTATLTSDTEDEVINAVATIAQWAVMVPWHADQLHRSAATLRDLDVASQELERVFPDGLPD